jgi:hypothetical protein
MHPVRLQASRFRLWRLFVGLGLVLAVAAGIWKAAGRPPTVRRPPVFQPRRGVDTSGLRDVAASLEPWPPTASLAQIGAAWRRIGYRNIAAIDRSLADSGFDESSTLAALFSKATYLNYEGEPAKAYAILQEIRSRLDVRSDMAENWLYTVIFVQGVTALRRGENENCVMCRGESSCILPIAPSAVHTNPEGSRLAVRHFTEYLERFPDDLEVGWLLNLAYMTLGEYPQEVDPRFLISLEHFRQCEFDIGRFRDIGHLVGVNRFNLSGGAIMEDFDNDGLLDIVTTTIDPTMPMAVYRNAGDGRFAECAAEAGVAGQLGGLYCVQTDFNNDGFIDIYIPRGAWIDLPMRPSLLQSNGDGTFSDITEQAKLLVPVNSNSATWADYDNDGELDLFVCCEAQPSRLFHNGGDGTFQEVARAAGLGQCDKPMCKGATWIDFDDDDFADLFMDFLTEKSRLFHNNGNSTFTDVSAACGIDGPMMGFSCWAWDYDNDGWLDIFATCYDRTLGDVVKGLLGRPHERSSNRLFHNVRGERFEDATRSAGLDLVFATMGSNFGDLDNDGFLDMYLGTGDPFIETLVPNRMFKNVAGRRFAEITACSATGHLQKGHAVACGDWDRDGNVDIFIEMGGIANGDKYHNVLFQNPGHDNQWLTVKLVGRKTNRPAIGARIKVVTAGDEPLTIHRHVTSGSSFGGNPLEQTIGLGRASRVARLEVHWPGSRSTQVYRDLAVNQSIQVTEFASRCRRLPYNRIPRPCSHGGG